MMRAALAFTILLALAACAPPSRTVRNGDVQVVAQFPDDTKERQGLVADVWGSISDLITEDRIEGACGDLCAFDGDDEEAGSNNLFLYTEDVPATVSMLVSLENAGKLRPGLRIGVAHYTDPQHTNWDYTPAYPKTLKRFIVEFSKAR